MTASHGHGTTGAGVASTALWGSVRLAVLDIETCNATDGDHIIDIAVVSCRRGIVTGRWDRKLNPGVPIDAETQKTHGLTDEEVAGSQTFAQVEPELTRLLTARDGEQLVLVAHNAPFDVSRLKLEYERAGQAMPDLAVLDTMALAKHVRLRTGDLASLVGALNIVNSKPHSALGDATATAAAVMAMLVTAAARTQDFDELLAQVMGRRKSRTSAIQVAGRKLRRPRPDDIAEPDIDLPAAHILGHAELLPKQPTADDLATWTARVSECGQLRCPYLEDRVDVAPLPPAEVLALLEPVLDIALRGGRPAVVATLLGAVLPVIGGLGNRPAALAWHKKWGPRLNIAGACSGDEACPACRTGQPCPLDTWHHGLAALALGSMTKHTHSQTSFLRTNGVNAGTGVFTTWQAKGHRQLADYAAWLVHEYWQSADQATRAVLLARYAWLAGGRDPRLCAAHARNTAAPGGAPHLQSGIDICEKALLSRAGSTDDGWRDLQATRGRLAGQLARRTLKPSGQVDTAGNPIPVRRHHPVTPERSRRIRFGLDR